MSKPVDSVQFWKDRIRYCQQHGKMSDSVYCTTDEDWVVINKQHEEYLNLHVSPTDKVLDAGCGYGRASEFIPGQYLGIDFCEDFIGIARFLYPTKKFAVGDIANLPNLPNQSIDWAVCISIKRMFEREKGAHAWKQIEDELLRVSKKGILVLEYGNKTGTTCRDIIRKLP